MYAAMSTATARKFVEAPMIAALPLKDNAVKKQTVRSTLEALKITISRFV